MTWWEAGSPLASAFESLNPHHLCWGGANGASRPVKESKTPSSFVSVLSIVGRVYLVSVVVLFPYLLLQRICHFPSYSLFSSTGESIEVFVWVAAETVDDRTKALDLGISCFSMFHLAGS